MSAVKSINLVGGRGYTGSELLGLIARHPGMDLGMASSRSYDGQPLSSTCDGWPDDGRVFTKLYAILMPPCYAYMWQFLSVDLIMGTCRLHADCAAHYCQAHRCTRSRMQDLGEHHGCHQQVAHKPWRSSTGCSQTATREHCLRRRTYRGHVYSHTPDRAPRSHDRSGVR